MASISRHVHPQSGYRYAPVAALAPDLQVTLADGDTAVPMGLAFIDPDGETHIYLLSEEARKEIVTALSGGIVLPDFNGRGAQH